MFFLFSLLSRCPFCASSLVVADVSDIMAKNRSYDGLAHVWTSWRDATGRKMKDLYAEFVRLGNEGVRTLGKTKALLLYLCGQRRFQISIKTN